jgi:hypothetical protein
MTPILTTLSYSAGVQSHALLEMVLRGDMPKPESFLVLNADPGMEDSRSYEFVDKAKSRCREAGIDFITAKGGDLYRDLTTFKERGLTRLDNPPYWTKNRETGKKGRLRQGCTQVYKIKAMRHAIREYLSERFGISKTTKRLPTVETWIGFAADEAARVGDSDVKFIRFKYPLIELGLDRVKVEGYYLKHGIPKPPRSVCNACFANGLSYLEDMYLNRPDDWDKAVAVDEAVRDMRQLGIRDEVFVSSSLVPLKDLPAINFKKGDSDYRDHRCNSGVCFL